jgi:biotin carboxylase
MKKCDDIELIILDGNPNSIGRDFSDSFYPVNISDINTVFELASSIGIDGIYSMNDHGVRAASYVSQGLDLQGITMSSAHACLDKGTMREVWACAGLEQPVFKVVTNQSSINQFCSENGFPVVIKPVDCGGGGRGVVVIHSENEISSSFETTSLYCNRNDRIIVEKFIDGIETSVEVFRYDGEIYLIACSDKVKADLRSRVAVSISYPGAFSKDVVGKIKEASEKAMLAVGIKEGVAHIEFIVTPKNEVFILELGARVGGGHTFHPIASHVSGLNYPQLVSSFYLRRKIEVNFLKKPKGACYYFMHPDLQGKLVDVEGFDAAKSEKNICIVELWKEKGSVINSLNSSMERAGTIVSLAETREEALESAQKANSYIKFVVYSDMIYEL